VGPVDYPEPNVPVAEGSQQRPVSLVAYDLHAESARPKLAAVGEVEGIHVVACNHPHEGAAVANLGLHQQVPLVALVKQVCRFETALGMAAFQTRLVSGRRTDADRPVVLPFPEVWCAGQGDARSPLVGVGCVDHPIPPAVLKQAWIAATGDQTPGMARIRDNHSCTSFLFGFTDKYPC